MQDAFKFPKIVPVGSFDMPGVDLFVDIVQDPDRRRKIASPVRDAWGPIDPVPGHTLVHVIALGDYESSGFNENGDAFKRAFLARAHPTFITHGGLYTRHKIYPDYPGEDVRKGDVIKTAQWPEMGRVELVVAADDNKCAHWLGDIEAGRKVAFSMGFDHDYDVCSICEHKAARRADYCEHVRKGARPPYGMGRILPDGRKCGVFNPSGVFNDISDVPTGACMIAFDLGKVAAAAERGMSGLDLGHFYFRHLGEGLRNARTLRRMGEEEKRAASLGDRPWPLPALGSARAGICGDPRSFFALSGARAGILPMRAFFKVALGGEYRDFEADVEGAARKQAGFIGSVLSDPASLHRVASNRSYDPPQHISASREDVSAISEIASEMAGMMSVGAFKLAAACEPPDHTPSLSARERVLSEEYLSYRLSCLGEDPGQAELAKAVMYV